VADRVANDDGHDVPQDKIRSRYRRLWANIADAIAIVDTAYVYDNTSSTHAFRRIATYLDGSSIGEIEWPDWTPAELASA
jgi:predicted ABC-type ATPase